MRPDVILSDKSLRLGKGKPVILFVGKYKVCKKFEKQASCYLSDINVLLMMDGG